MPRVSGGYHGHGYSLGVEVKPDGSAHCYDCGLNVPKQNQLDDVKCTPGKSQVSPSVAVGNSAEWATS